MARKLGLAVGDELATTLETGAFPFRQAQSDQIPELLTDWRESWQLQAAGVSLSRKSKLPKTWLVDLPGLFMCKKQVPN